MLIVMSVIKLTLTYELLKLNSALKLIFSVIKDQCSGGPPDLSPSCSTLSVLLNAKNTSIRIYKYQ